MVEILSKLHQKRAQVDAGFRLLDTDGSGAIDAEEFERGLVRLLNRPLDTEVRHPGTPKTPDRHTPARTAWLRSAVAAR